MYIYIYIILHVKYNIRVHMLGDKYRHAWREHIFFFVILLSHCYPHTGYDITGAIILTSILV